MAKPTDLLGAHVSTSGGLHTAPARAAEIDSRVMQIFTSAPQKWSEGVEISEAEADAFRAACEEHGIASTTVHASYLLNHATPKADLYERSVRGLVAELVRCEAIGADHLVLHPGSATDGDRAAGLERNAKAVLRALQVVPGNCRLLLEGTSGKGNVLGRTFEELATMIAFVVASEPALETRIGVCLDTCHLYAAGYDLVNDYKGVMAELRAVLDPALVHCWHINDSEGALGSTTDRHSHIGEGHIGAAAFGQLVNDPLFANTPMLLETPKTPDAVTADTKNLGVLRALRRG